MTYLVHSTCLLWYILGWITQIASPSLSACLPPCATIKNCMLHSHFYLSKVYNSLQYQDSRLTVSRHSPSYAVQIATETSDKWLACVRRKRRSSEDHSPMQGQVFLMTDNTQILLVVKAYQYTAIPKAPTCSVIGNCLDHALWKHTMWVHIRKRTSKSLGGNRERAQGFEEARRNRHQIRFPRTINTKEKTCAGTQKREWETERSKEKERQTTFAFKVRRDKQLDPHSDDKNWQQCTSTHLAKLMPLNSWFACG